MTRPDCGASGTDEKTLELIHRKTGGLWRTGGDRMNGIGYPG